MKHIICCYRRILMWMWNMLIVEWSCRNMFVRYGEGRANLVLVEEGWLSWRWPFFYDDLKVSKCISLSQQECTSWNNFFFLYNSWYEFEWIKRYNRRFNLHNLAYYMHSYRFMYNIKKKKKFTYICLKIINISLYIIM